ncbi:NAD-dependent epimerase/dehydratase family protein [Crenobacter sp. SG2303]|uniref:NAD-dependent epimerase/dehydratase family protein n=1 Tax=Crenobacter oryzisoli TaxID=3056844 RepID=A0ABT7XR01_9NEIS|nr:hopanoid-associated sugar epimerase [Crenobacter sp. SG2303]MDN0076227.1 NAD-dependent epimerase/dehydratase family protein [Crenobacter sp. SG2303]
MTAEDDILVTGAAGFLGSAVVRRALARGLRVRALVRPSSPRRNLETLPVHMVEGDMRDGAAMERALSGVRYLFHVAADYRLWAPNPEDIVRTNTAGTEVVMQAALRCGVEHVVYTSSVATLRVAGATAPVTEEATMDAGEAIGAYKRSKVLAERLVEHMVTESGLPAVIVNPSTPIGPRDVRPTPTGRIILEAASGKMPAFVDTGLNLAHVDDVAEGHFLALERGNIGERYILGGQDVSLQQMLQDIAALTGRRAPTVQLPRWPLYPLAHIAEAIARLTRREPFITVDGLDMSRYRMFFSSEKAHRMLGYQPRAYQEGLRDALAWFREAGYLR